MALVMAGYLSVQSLPRRVRICALPASSRACIRYPSNLISCSQSEPSGAFSTSAASCGLIQAGGGAGLTLRRVGGVRADFAIPFTYQNSAPFVGACVIEPPRRSNARPERIAVVIDDLPRAPDSS